LFYLRNEVINEVQSNEQGNIFNCNLSASRKLSFLRIFGSDAPFLFFSFQVFAEALDFPVSSDDEEVLF